MSDWLERLSARVAVPECFSLMTYDTEDGVRIVEAKDIPEGTPIIAGPARTFFHEDLVRHLRSCGAEISHQKRVYLFRESTGFSTDKYLTISVENHWPFQEMTADDFRPAMINVVDEINVVFFSREYFDRLSTETILVFNESPTIYLVPIGFE